MKSSVLILSTVLAASSTMVSANFHLRASTPQVQDPDADASLDRRRHKKVPSPSGKWGFMGADITLTHVSNDMINLDEEKVSQAFIEAYNKVHDNGYRVTTGFVEKAVVIPESADFSNVIYYHPFGYDCPNCPAEFGLGGDEDRLEATSRPKPADDSKVHEKFESYFLSLIVTNRDMSDTTGVNIVLTYTDPTTTITTTTADDKSLTEEQPAGFEKGKTKPSDSKSLHGQIEISHTMVSNSSTMVIDMKAVGDAYKQSFDEVYSVMDYEVTNFDLESEIDIPEDAGPETEAEEGNPDNLDSYYYKYYFLSGYSYEFGYDCRLCPNDDDLLGFSLDLVAMQGTGAHLYFEKLFCHKMKTSGLFQFKKINHCSIVFDAASSAAISDASFADSEGVVSPQ